MQLTISPRVEALLQQELSTGRFSNPDELLETALHVLSDSTPSDLDQLRADIQEGIDSADRGELYSESEARAWLASARKNS